MARKVSQNYKFTDSALVNDKTYFDYLERLKKVALSMFEWVNLPDSMNARWLERCLYYKGQAALLKDEKFGFINTSSASAGHINIYGLPTRLNCYGYNYQSFRKLYSGLNPMIPQEQTEKEQAVLVMNNWEKIPTAYTLELFALRLYEAERATDVNIKAQKFPLIVSVDETQRLMMENLMNQYDGNQPFIFGDKKQLNDQLVKAIKTDSPFVADKLQDYKLQIWNEALMFLGINTLSVEKRERLISEEASANNEFINLNLQSYLAPRQEACKQFNEMFGLTGTDKEISVRVRSDLHNIIKEAQSVINDYKELEIIDDIIPDKVVKESEVKSNG